MTKDARLSIRITPDLDTWLDAEASSRGLDKAAFARMVLFERMNGIVKGPAPAEMAVSYSQVDQALAALPDGYMPMNGNQVDPNIDALVAARVADALSRQLHSYGEGETGMQAHRRGGLREYGGVANGGVPFRHQRHAVYGA